MRTFRKDEPKVKVKDSKIVESLENLKKELIYRQDNSVVREILFKINSCLFSEYPHEWQK